MTPVRTGRARPSQEASKTRPVIVGREEGDEEEGILVQDPLWYKDAIIYELHVRSFFDSDNDGIGDFAGLTRKLDYLQELGVTALWLLPFYPSPLRDDGYDIADYRSVNPAYGKLSHFRDFLAEAHRRGLRVITELVINHTSDQHPWFQRARRAPVGSPERDFYVWSDDPTRYGETRIIFQDFENSNWTWDPVADAYFWHRFYHHQPDLNFDNPAVCTEVFKALDYWLEMGVDGLRLDAVPYLFEREGTNCENLPETHDFLKRLRRHVDENFEGRMLLAEANQWPEDAAQYFGDGDECHMNFHFPIMPRLFMALRMEDRFPIVDILEQTPEIPDNCQWAVFLRNHDELTLEMVTDEERDYMYRVYAHDTTARINLGIRRRLAPLIQNNRRKIELMNSLLFALPGTPVLYYGDEIGMGDNFYLGDRNGVRTPMQWNGDRNAGFSKANPQKLFLPIVIDPEYHYESVNVEAQLENPSSILWWMRRLISLRKQHQAFGRGDLRFLSPRNKHVLAFLRSFEGETLLIVTNLSRFAQAVELDLAGFEGSIPIELFGRTPFPGVDDRPYLLTLGPHSFYWFILKEGEREREVRRKLPEERGEAAREEELVTLHARKSWEEVLHGWSRGRFKRALTPYLQRQRWFAGKSRSLRAVRFGTLVPMESGGSTFFLTLLRVEYVTEDAEHYVLPLAFSSGADAARILDEHPGMVICRLEVGETEGIVHDGLAHPGFTRLLLDTIAEEREFGTSRGSVLGVSGRERRDILGDPGTDLEVGVGSAEQSNSSIIYGRKWILKLFRRLEPGTNLDREIGDLLTRESFANTPGVAGSLEFREEKEPASTLAVLQEYVPNHGDAWDLSLNALSRYYERALASPTTPELLPAQLLGRIESEPPEAAHALVDDAYLEMVRLLGRRTGELHLVLGRASETPGFGTESFSSMYQRSLYQSMRNLVNQTFTVLERQLPKLDEDVRRRAALLMTERDAILDRFRQLLRRRVDGARIRCHGDYHLGQVLFTGKDFVIIDFEGEPSRPLTERRLKRSPLRDVAGMLRSFDYAAHVAQVHLRDRGLVGSDSASELDPWARFWHHSVSAVFLTGYFNAVQDADFLPSASDDRRFLLEIYLLEKALYELAYELNNRPGWSHIPLDGILRILGRDPQEGGMKDAEASGGNEGEAETADEERAEEQDDP